LAILVILAIFVLLWFRCPEKQWREDNTKQRAGGPDGLEGHVSNSKAWIFSGLGRRPEMITIRQRWSDSGFLLSDPILCWKNDIRIWSESCFGWNHTIRIRKLSANTSKQRGKKKPHEAKKPYEAK